MGWPFRRGRQVTVTRYELDRRTQERSTPTPHVLERCAYDPGSSQEDNGIDDSTLTGPRIFAAYDADVLPTDDITVVGVEGTWQVDGEVKRWRNDLTGTQACSEIRLTRKRGAR